MLSWMTRDQVIGIANDIERVAETAAARRCGLAHISRTFVRRPSAYSFA